MLALLGCLCFLSGHSTIVTPDTLRSPLHLSLPLPLQGYVMCDRGPATKYLYLFSPAFSYHHCGSLCDPTTLAFSVFEISNKETMQRSADSRISDLGPLHGCNGLKLLWLLNREEILEKQVPKSAVLTFLIVWPFNTVHVVVTLPSHKIIFVATS